MHSSETRNREGDTDSMQHYRVGRMSSGLASQCEARTREGGAVGIPPGDG